MSWIEPVAAMLDGAPEPIDVFLRDDDAGWRDDRLLPLLDVVEEYDAPLDVAAIPAALDCAIARELVARPQVGIHQHGFAHRNHEPVRRRLEFGPSRSFGEQRRDIAEGARRLEERLGAVADPIFTPPWNRCTEATGRCLLDLGFAMLSRESRAARLALPGLLELPVHVDWVRTERDELGARIAGALRAGHPAGIMLHHAVMDEGDLGRVGELLALLTDHPGARLRRMRDWLG
jgi:hypothetical protein